MTATVGILSAIYALICGHPVPPLPRVFEGIALEECKLGVNDCSNKAGKYARALMNKGYDPIVIIIQPHDLDADRHALVLVDGLVCDPTTGKVSRNITDFGNLLQVVSRNQVWHDEEFA